MKKLLIGSALVLALIIAAALAVPFFIPLDTYKGKIVALVKQQTGRDLRINGPIRFSLLPSIALEANDVSLSNAPGASVPNMIQLKTLAIAVKLFPLLHGAVEVERFKLVQPAITLEVDKEGRPNWVFKPTTPAATPAQPTAPGTAPAGTADNSRISDVSLGEVSIVDGQASYLDQRNGEKRLLGDINMTLSLPSLNQPFKAKGAATWNGEKTTLTLDIERPGTLQNGGVSPVAITLAAAPINFAFKGDATGATLAKLVGGIDLSVPSVRGLAKWVGVPFDAPGTGFGLLTISGHLDMAGPKIAFNQAVIVFDAIKATGGLTIDSSRAKPAYSGRLDVDKLDVNPYLPPENGKAAAPATPVSVAAPEAPATAPPPATAAAAKGTGWSDTPLDLSPLKIANAEFNLSVNSIQYRKIEIGRSALALHLQEGKLEADLTEMALYQGKGTGKVVADGSGPTSAIGAAFNLTGVAMQPLLRDAAAFDRLVATGNISLDVTGHGRSQRDIVGTLNGKGSLNLANGKIDGVNLMAFAKNAVGLGGGKGAGNQTDFGALTGTYTITNGILHNNDLRLTSSEVPMIGAGTVDLPLRQVDYKLTPSLGGIVAVPVDITGSWDNLSYRPDLAGMAESLFQNPDKAIDALKQGGGAKGLLKGLLGR
jgi:AsmA protein